ncbi:MAG TPA: phospho-sugar mutase [Polyangiaceae bacterium]|jgi:phosphomannomutase|nr:MAG: Phosphoglucomutase [Deltaproteobacteria bacterium ADurb.Bin207]HNS98705.1 phospho-sugar mutase [Polyangiaceae bacterium]HNZ21971.1 phospho-sugar mutase [Polyangiaceae bacterium]HOD23155.1 phospho-sugar mutase [Polyangiaceae bacterium]HOE50348.1 phospho-sugar mutase [Polyangiaceae bacterium]
MNDVIERAKRWAQQDIDEETRGELLALVEQQNVSDLEDRMAGCLDFGTAGLRGILGAGSNRMNRAVVARTTAGLAKHLLATFPDAASRGVVVGYDARRKSREFAEQAAQVLAGQGIVTHLFPSLATTPQTAFATIQLGAVAGVMVTASHNPPEYNGYKVYWANGAQIIPPQDEQIVAAIEQTPPANEIPTLSLEDARERGLLRPVDNVITERYLRTIEQLSRHSQPRSDLRIVYTPMHGVGLATAMEALKRAGFDQVVPVASQAAPNGEFPTVHFPNPEEPGAMDLAFATAKETGADLILANDPDADRLAVAVPNRDGDGFLQLSGNQVGVLLAHYYLAYDPSPPKDRLFVTTIVSSPMLGAMARQEGARYEETLTGFKWIANRAMQVEADTGTTFIAGYEEALGYTIGTAVRDKDGVSAVAVFAEMTAYLRSQGRSILDELELMYRKYGLYVSRQVSRWHRGLDGAQRIQQIMAKLRAAPPSRLEDFDVVAVRDYQQQLRTQRDGTRTTLDLPKSNVLSFELEGGSRIVARPSGTEPKIKFYFDHREVMHPEESLPSAEKRANERLDRLVNAFLQAAE